MKDLKTCDGGTCNKLSAIRDISLYGDPSVVEKLDYEKILLKVKDQIQQQLPEQIQVNQLYEGDPIVKIAETIAYRELVTRQRINDALKDSYLKTAQDGGLSQLLYLFGIQRSISQSQDGREHTDQEMINSLITLYEETNTGGAAKSYQNICLSIDNVKDAFIEKDQCIPAKVNIYVWVDAVKGSSIYSEAMEQVKEKIDQFRPITDWVEIKPIKIKEYTIKATLTIPASIAYQDIKKKARNNLRQYLNEHHKLGNHVMRSELIAKLNKDGVIRVELHFPHEILVDGGELAVLMPEVRTLTSQESYLFDGGLEYSDEELDSLLTFKTESGEDSIVRLKPREIVFKGINEEHRCVIPIGASRTLEGEIKLVGAENEQYIRGYNLYFGKSESQKYSNKPFCTFKKGCHTVENTITFMGQSEQCIQKVTNPDQLPEKPALKSYLLPLNPNLLVPDDVTHIIAFSFDSFGEMTSGISIPIRADYVPLEGASSLVFDETYANKISNQKLTGVVKFDAPNDASVTHYNLYWADGNRQYISDPVAGGTNENVDDTIVPIQVFQKSSCYEKYFQEYSVPGAATQLMLVSANLHGEMGSGLSLGLPLEES